MLGEATTFSAATAAVAAIAGQASAPARGRPGQRGYRAAVNAVVAVPPVPASIGRPALSPHLEFLSLVSVGELEGGSEAPWALISFLAGLLGPCLTQGERNRPASQVQLSARALFAGCRARFYSEADDHYSAAGNLRDYLLKVADALPPEFYSAGVDAASLRSEGRDAITYSRDADGRRSVEESRVLTFGAR